VAAVGVGLWKEFSRVDTVHASEAAHDPRPAAVAAYARLMTVFERMRVHQAEICQLLLDSGL
jgi:hypothetical protein